MPETGGRATTLIAVVLGVVLYVVFLVWLHPLVDRHGAAAAIRKSAADRRAQCFALQKALYFCHKTEGQALGLARD